MSSFLNFACGAARSRSPRGILRVVVLNLCAARGILPRALCVRTACRKALRAIASLGLKQNSCFKILKQGLKFAPAPAFFGRNSFFKICTRFKFKDGLPKRSCLASPTTAITASPAATLPRAAATSSASFASAQVRAPMRASTQIPVQIQASAQVQAGAEFKSVVSKSTVAKRAIFKFMKFTIFSRAALKFKNSPLAQRRALV